MDFDVIGATKLFDEALIHHHHFHETLWPLDVQI
jgi:hypothetical protein